MSSLCFYFQVHQPYRIKRYRVFDIGFDENYFNDAGEGNLNNQKILHKVAKKCYLPANKIFLDLLEKHRRFKISYSFSGVALEQFETMLPEVLYSFQKLVDTGQVEILAETYHHSLYFFYSKKEFEDLVRMHQDLVKRLFGVKPKVFRNTELSYRNDLAHWAEGAGYDGIIAEGWDGVLGWRSPNFLYQPKGTSKIKLLLKNYRLSDDIAFRFSSREWKEYPLTVPKFSQWVNAVNGNGETINLFMDYETFGEHQWEDSGIFEFLKALPEEILKHPDNDFKTPSEVIRSYPARGEIDAPHTITWADTERDLTAWIGNSMQQSAIALIYSLEEAVLKARDPKLLENWRKLQTSDHFYYMCTKWFSDGDVHAYFSPYETPYEAFIAYMNAVNDLRFRTEECEKQNVMAKPVDISGRIFAEPAI